MECAVIDNGCSTMKVGFSGDDKPTSIIPMVTGVEGTSVSNSAVGLVRNDNQENKVNTFWVGNKAKQNAERLEITSPIERGFVKDWDAMQACWEYAFEHELQIEPESMPVLLTDTPLNDKASREKMAQIMFERFHTPGLYIAPKSVLSLFATGRTRGIVLGLGAGITSVVPVFEGYSLTHATKRLDFAGEDLTDFLAEKLKIRLDRDTVQDIKEKVCVVSRQKYTTSQPVPTRKGSFVNAKKQATDSRQEEQTRGAASNNNGNNQHEGAVPYELPDGTIVDINKECQNLIPEALFDPSIKNPDIKVGVAHLTFQSILGCDKTLQNDLFGSIVIAGGSSMFPGFAQRVEEEMLELSQAVGKVQVVQDSQRKYAAWIGGSMFASLETYPQIQISRSEWEENGNRIVHQKCL